MAPGSTGGICRLQPHAPVSRSTQAEHKRNREPFTRVDSSFCQAYAVTCPNELALGSGSGPRLATGDVDRDTSKGADEQSSRKAPGSLADPGVCVCSAKNAVLHFPVMNPVDVTIDLMESATRAPMARSMMLQ
jgi:hypothetical protein